MKTHFTDNRPINFEPPVVCFLDMDGVIVDFTSAVFALLGEPVPKKFEWDFVPPHLWDRMGYAFWAHLDPTPHAHEIVAACEESFGRENICILSSPVITHGCADGKVEWLRRHFPQYQRRFLIGPEKQFCAGPNKWLVDDSEHHAKRFLECGGNPILVPAPYNRRAGVLTTTVIGEILGQVSFSSDI